MQSIDFIETYEYGMNKDLVCEKEEIRLNNWPEIPDDPYRILKVGGSGSGKTNALSNPINHEPDIDKIYLYTKDPYEAKYQLLSNKRESTDLKYLILK